jgi:acetyl esterase/lipase
MVKMSYCNSLIVLCLLTLTTLNVSPQTTNRGKMLFVIAGQSNAVGQGDSTKSINCTGLPCFEYDVVMNVVKPLKDPVGQKWRLLERANTGSIGPSFAKRMNELTHAEVYMVAAARGGASCHRKSWLPPYNTWDERGGMMNDATAKIDMAIKSCGAPLTGILWLQGERDANAILDGQLTEKEYKQALKSVIIRFRMKYGKDLPFYIVMTGFQKNRAKTGCTVVRKVQREVCEEFEKVFIVYDTGLLSSDGKSYKDIVHYNQDALNDIGKSVAENVVKDLSVTYDNKTITNKYAWHLKVGSYNEYCLTDEKKIKELIDIDSVDSALVPYYYTPQNVKDEDCMNCKTIADVYKQYTNYKLPIEIDLPEGKGPFPFVIYIHGGGWGGGNLNVYKRYSQYIASKGIAGIRIAYSLTGQGGTFAQVQKEIDEALNYVNKHHKQYKLDMSRWGIVGASAGAHLGGIAAMRIKGCQLFIGMYGAYDLLKSRDDNFPSWNLCKRYLGNTDEKTLMKASAIYQIPKINIPHVLLIHGTADLTINCEQSKYFADMLRNKGADVKEIYYPNYGHSLTMMSVSDVYEDLLKNIYEYSRDCFMKNEEKTID